MIKTRRGRNSPFDWNLVDSLVGLKASESYVAQRILIKEGRELTRKNEVATIKFIQRHIQEEWGLNYVQYCAKKSEHVKITLYQTMIHAALVSKNITMMIFLAKQILGMSDKVETKQEVQTQANVTYETKWGSSVETTDSKDDET